MERICDNFNEYQNIDYFDWDVTASKCLLMPIKDIMYD